MDAIVSCRIFFRAFRDFSKCIEGIFFYSCTPTFTFTLTLIDLFYSCTPTFTFTLTLTDIPILNTTFFTMSIFFLFRFFNTELCMYNFKISLFQLMIFPIASFIQPSHYFIIFFNLLLMLLLVLFIFICKFDL